MSTIFRLYDAEDNEISIAHDEATEDGEFFPRYVPEISQEKTAGGQIKQQIRPGLRFAKAYILKLSEAQYITFMRLITNQSNDYYIEYTTAPSMLTNDTDALENNNIKVAISLSDVDATYGNQKLYSFRAELFSADLL
jgi:hypothetical protein